MRTTYILPLAMVLILLQALAACGPKPTPIQESPPATIPVTQPTAQPSLPAATLPEPTREAEQAALPTEPSPTQAALATATDEGAPPALDAWRLDSTNISQIVPLRRLSRAPVGRISHAAWSGDGTLLALSGSTGVGLYRADTLEQVWLADLGKSAIVAAFSPDSSSLAVAYSDYQVHLLAVSDSESQSSPQINNSAYIYGLAFSPDGSILVIARERSILVWDIAKAKVTRTLEQVSGIAHVTALAFSADGQWLMAGNAEGLVQTWDMNTGTRKRVFTPADVSEPGGECAGSAANGGLLNLPCAVTSSKDGLRLLAWLWQVNSGGREQRLVKLSMGKDWEATSGLAISPDGGLAAVRNPKGDIQVWSLAGTPQLARTLPGEPGWHVQLSFQPPDGRYLAVIPQDGSLRIWDTASGALAHEIAETTASISGIAVSRYAGGYQIAAGRQDNQIDLWDLDSGEIIQTFVTSANFDSTSAVALSADGHWLAAANRNYGELIVWDLASPSPQASLTLQAPNSKWETSVLQLDFSPDGKRLAASTSQGEIHLWEVETGTLQRSLSIGHGWIYAIAFHPAGSLLAVASQDNSLQVWDATTGKQAIQIKRSSGQGAQDQFLAFSPDGVMLASVNEVDKRIEVWEVASGSLLASQPSGVNYGALQFNPDQCSLLNAFILRGMPALDDGIQIPGWRNALLGFDAVFSPDGRLLISGDLDGSVRLWGLPGALEAPPGDKAVQPVCPPRAQATSTPVPSATLPATPTSVRTATLTPKPAATLTLTPQPTLTPTAPALGRTLYLASPNLSGDDVLQLQVRLKTLGYSEVGEPDGVFGPMTDQAVRRFQERNGLAVDGVVGPMTWERLFSAAALPAP